MFTMWIQGKSLRNGSSSNIEIWRVIAAVAVPSCSVCNGKTDEIDLLINGLIRFGIARQLCFDSQASLSSFRTSTYAQEIIGGQIWAI